jgi:hypothetical protein
LLTATLFCMGQVRGAGTQFQTVRAATANDVINEMPVTCFSYTSARGREFL